MRTQEANEHGRETRAALDEEQQKRIADDQRKEQAREFLSREFQKLVKDREAREANSTLQERKSTPVGLSPSMSVSSVSKKAVLGVCKCGYPGCLGHEVIDNHAIFPGFTSEAARANSPRDVVVF